MSFLHRRCVITEPLCVPVRVYRLKRPTGCGSMPPKPPKEIAGGTWVETFKVGVPWDIPAAYWGYGYPAWFFNMSTSKTDQFFKGNFNLPTSNHQFAQGILVFSGALSLGYTYCTEIGRHWTGMEDGVARNTSRKSTTHYRTPQEKHSRTLFFLKIPGVLPFATSG